MTRWLRDFCGTRSCAVVLRRAGCLDLPRASRGGVVEDSVDYDRRQRFLTRTASYEPGGSGVRISPGAPSFVLFFSIFSRGSRRSRVWGAMRGSRSGALDIRSTRGISSAQASVKTCERGQVDPGVMVLVTIAATNSITPCASAPSRRAAARRVSNGGSRADRT